MPPKPDVAAADAAGERPDEQTDLEPSGEAAQTPSTSAVTPIPPRPRAPKGSSSRGKRPTPPRRTSSARTIAEPTRTAVPPSPPPLPTTPAADAAAHAVADDTTQVDGPLGSSAAEESPAAQESASDATPAPVAGEVAPPTDESIPEAPTPPPLPAVPAVEAAAVATPADGAPAPSTGKRKPRLPRPRRAGRGRADSEVQPGPPPPLPADVVVPPVPPLPRADVDPSSAASEPEAEAAGVAASEDLVETPGAPETPGDASSRDDGAPVEAPSVVETPEDPAEASSAVETPEAPAVTPPVVESVAAAPESVAVAAPEAPAGAGTIDVAVAPVEAEAVETSISAVFDAALHTDAEADGVPAALAVRGVTKIFGDTRAVDGIDLTVPAGSFYGLVGPNGAGKTTTLSMIAGLLRPDRGTIVVNGIDSAADPRHTKRLMGVLPDRLRTFDRLTGRQLLYYCGVLRGLAPSVVESRTADLARAFDLADALGRPVSDYSAGMTKKVMLAGAMIHSPRLLVLDEPFEAVDPVSSAVILDILSAYVAHGGTVILSSHGMSLVERVCTRVAVIVAGQVLAEGTIDEVRGEMTLEQRFIELAGGLSDVEGLEWLHTFSG
jgi:ABC-2 type transport system ATP-binding protein